MFRDLKEFWRIKQNEGLTQNSSKDDTEDYGEIGSKKPQDVRIGERGISVNGQKKMEGRCFCDEEP